MARVWLAALIAASLSLSGARAQEVTGRCPDEPNVRAAASGERIQWVVHLQASESNHESVHLLTVKDGAGGVHDFVVLDRKLSLAGALETAYMLVALFDEERSEQLAASVEQLTDHSW